MMCDRAVGETILNHWEVHCLPRGSAPLVRHNTESSFKPPWDHRSWWTGLVKYLQSMNQSNPLLTLRGGGGGRGGGSSVGRARDSWWGGPGFDSRCGRPLPTGWVGVCIMWPTEMEVMVSQLCLMCGSTLNCQTLCLGARQRYNLVVDEDVENPTNQPNKAHSASWLRTIRVCCDTE